MAAWQQGRCLRARPAIIETKHVERTVIFIFYDATMYSSHLCLVGEGVCGWKKTFSSCLQLMLYTTFRIDPQDAIQALSLCIWRRTYKYRCKDSTSIQHGRVMCQTPSRFECLLYSVFTRLSLSTISQPHTGRRGTCSQLLNSSWGRSIGVCLSTLQNLPFY